MKKMKKFVFAALIFASNITYSADWTRLGVYGNDNSYTINYIDTDSITYYTANPHIKNFWVLANHNRPQSRVVYNSVAHYESEKRFIDLNCSTRQLQTTAVYFYERRDGRGRAVDSRQFNTDYWNNIIPDSLSWQFMEIVCSKEELRGSKPASNHARPSPTPPARPNSLPSSSSNGNPYYDTAIADAVTKYATENNADLTACMSKKVLIYARRLKEKEPTTYYENGAAVIDAATKGTIRTCRAEADAIFKGPSFDCSKASNSTEQTICDTPALSQMDVQFSNAVSAAKIMTPHKTSITNNLRTWIKERNECGAQVDCIQASYRRGMQYIESL